MNNTLLKGLALLEVLARHGQPMGVSELAAASKMPKSGVHRLLQALVDMRYVEPIESGRYRVSTKLWEIASAALPSFDLRRHAEAAMTQLADDTGVGVHLSVLDRYDVVYLHKIEATKNPPRAYSQIGGRVPAHCVATGKAMLAFKGLGWISNYATQLRPATPNTITSPGVFLTEMTRVRSLGYASNRGGWRIDIHGLAAPVFDDMGSVVGAIGVSGRADEIEGARRGALVEQVLEAGQRLSTTSAATSSHSLLLSVTNHWRQEHFSDALTERLQLC